MQVGTVNDAIRVLVAPAINIAAHRNARDLVTGDGVAHDQVLGQERHGAHGLRESHPVEHLEHVRDRAGCRRRSRRIRRIARTRGTAALGRERQRGSETADSPPAISTRSVGRASSAIVKFSSRNGGREGPVTTADCSMLGPK